MLPAVTMRRVVKILEKGFRGGKSSILVLIYRNEFRGERKLRLQKVLAILK